MIETKNKIGVVISRYYEDLKWVEKIEAPLDIYIYNRKGDCEYKGITSAAGTTIDTDICKDMDNIGNLDIEKVKNNDVNLNIIVIPDDPGYECSTYAYHCHSRYDFLNDYTLFLQAHPTRYIADIVRKLNNPYEILHTTYIPNTFRQLLPPTIEINYMKRIEFQYISDKFNWLDPAYEYCWSWYYPDFSKAPWWEFCQGHPNWTTDCSKAIDTFSFGAGEQFIVSKKRILNHDADYYKRIQQFTQTFKDPHLTRPDYIPLYYGPGIMEGIWQFVF